MNRFHASIQTRDAVTVVELYGDLTEDTSRQLEPVMDASIQASSQIILLNFRYVDILTTAGIAQIITLLAKTRATHKVATAGLSEHYRHIFKIMRLDSYIQHFPDEASALAALSAPA